MEDAMILAVPILIAVAIFLGWALVTLTVHALPLFAGASIAMVVLRAGGGPTEAVACGAGAALAVAALGRFAFGASRSPAVRALIALAFAAPAAIAAYHAALGVSALVDASGAWRSPAALMIAFLIGAAAWRGIASTASGYRLG
jgi:hypothetical protein